MAHHSPSKPNRNAPCLCGSGKKYKTCCADKAAIGSNRPTTTIENLAKQAQLAVARSDFAEAEQCFRQLTKIKPGDAYFLASLGQALCWLKRRREGVTYLLQAAKRLERQAAKSRDPRFAVELSIQLMHWGEIVAAERLARLAVTLSPDSPAILNNLALCLSRINKNAEALPISQRVCQLLPDHPGCNILLAMLEARLVGTPQALSRLNHLIARNDEPEQTARAWLEKAIILDKNGSYDEAFSALTLAGSMHSALLPYGPGERDALFATLAVNRKGFDSQLLRRWPAATLIDDGLPSPTFLLGFLRSGTTLTEQVLDSHPRLFATDESTIVHELTLALQTISGITADHPAALNTLSVEQLKQLRQFYWRRMREEYGDQVMEKQLIDKNALNTIDLGVISVVFPEAKILFALRDPRDVCLSCFMQAFSPTPATVNLLTWQGIAKQYVAVMDYWLNIRETIQPQYLELRYEDTVTDFETTYRQVFAFLGVEWHAAVSQFHGRAKGRYISTPSFAAVSQPVYSTAVYRWRHYQKHFTEIQSKLQPFIDAFGYASEAGSL